MLVKGWFYLYLSFLILELYFPNYIGKLINIALAEEQIETFVKVSDSFSLLNWTNYLWDMPCLFNTFLSISCSICFWILWGNTLQHLSQDLILSKGFYWIKLDTVFFFICLILFVATESLFFSTQKLFLLIDWVQYMSINFTGKLL